MPRISETNLNISLHNSTVSSGLVGSLPSFVDNNDGTYTVGDCDVLLYDNDRQEGSPKMYHITGGLRDITTASNEVRYLFVDYNSGSPQYEDWTYAQLPNWNSSDATPIYTMYNENNILIQYFCWDGLGQGLADKNHRRILKTLRFARESGADLSVTDPANSIQCTEGIIWLGSIEHDLPAFDSSTVGHRFYFWHNTGTGLTIDITQTGGIVDSAVVNAGGTGYYQDDVIEITGGGGTGATISLDTVSSGVVTAISIVSGGTGYSNTTGATTYEGWIQQVTTDGTGTYDKVNYDGGDGALPGGGSAGVNPVSDGSFVINWVYRDAKNTYGVIVLGEQSFGTLAEAQGSCIRSDLPIKFSVTDFLIGRIIIQKNGTSANLVESIFSQAPLGLVTSHSALSGLQGGQTEEYFHLNSAQQQHVTAGLPLCLSTYNVTPEKNTVQNVHGSLLAIADQSGTVLNSGTNITGNNGQSKLMISVGAVTTNGTITITGDTVNPDTGAVTASDTENIIIPATNNTTTDTSTTDANGIDLWGFTDGYITTKWFRDGFTISTTDASLTSVDIYQISYEQFNYKTNVVIDSIDANFYVTNTGASLSGHFYTVVVTDSRVDVTQIATEVWTTGTGTAFPVAARYYRIRDGSLDININGSTDGIFVALAFQGVGSYFNDVGLKIWTRILP